LPFGATLEHLPLLSLCSFSSQDDPINQVVSRQSQPFRNGPIPGGDSEARGDRRLEHGQNCQAVGGAHPTSPPNCYGKDTKPYSAHCADSPVTELDHGLGVLGRESREEPGNALGGDALGRRLANQPEIRRDSAHARHGHCADNPARGRSQQLAHDVSPLRSSISSARRFGRGRYGRTHPSIGGHRVDESGGCAGRFMDDVAIPDKTGSDKSERVRLNLQLEASE
jgi:hypothetical protein